MYQYEHVVELRLHLCVNADNTICIFVWLIFADDGDKSLEGRLDDFLGRPDLHGAFQVVGDRDILKRHLLNKANHTRTANIIAGLLRLANERKFVEQKGNLICLRHLIDASKGEALLTIDYYNGEKIAGNINEKDVRCISSLF